MNTIKNNIYTDSRGGHLIPIEFHSLSFIPKRIFTVSGVPKDHVRGEHAHYETEQLLLCVKGSIAVYLDYGKSNEITTTVLKPGQSIYIPKMVWDSQKFLTGDDFMVVLASTNYDLSDYILDKNTFYGLTK